MAAKATVVDVEPGCRDRADDAEEQPATEDGQAPLPRGTIISQEYRALNPKLDGICVYCTKEGHWENYIQEVAVPVN